jgi:hypothetical protein
MIKIKDLDEIQLDKQLKKHSKILKALRREQAKRNSLGSEIELECDGTQTGKRVRKIGTITNLKVPKSDKPDKTSSSLYQLQMDEEE